MTVTWHSVLPYSDTSGGTITALVGPNFAIGGSVVWAGTSPNRRLEIDDDVSAVYTASAATVNGWLNGQPDLVVVVKWYETPLAEKTLYEICGINYLNGTQSNQRCRMSSSGQLNLRELAGGTTDTELVRSDTSVYTANTAGILMCVREPGHATSADRQRLYFNSVRLGSLAVYNAPSGNLIFTSANSRVAFGGGPDNSNTINGGLYYSAIGTGTITDSEVEDYCDQLALDDDTEPTEGGGDQEIEPTGIAGSAAFQTHTLAPGAVSVTAPELTGSAAFGTHTTTLYCTPAPIDGAAAIVAPSLSPGAVTILHAALDGLAAFGTHVLSLFLTPGVVTGSAGFQTHTLVPGAVAITPGVIDGDADVPDPEILAGNFLAAGELAGQGLLGSHTVTPGGVTIAHSPLAGAGLLGAHTVSPGAATVTPNALDGAAALGSHTVTPGTATIAAPTLTGAATLPAPTLSPGDVLISPAALAGSGLLDSPALGLYLALAPLAGSGALGSHALSLGAPTINPTALGGLGLLGSHALTGGLQFAGARLDTSESFLLRHSNTEDLALRYGCAETMGLP